MVSSAPPGEPVVDLSNRISLYDADSAVRAIMGGRFKDRAAFFRLLEQGLKLFSNPSLPDLYPSSRLAMFISRTPSLMKKQRVEMMAFMETIIQEHQVRRGDDVDDEEEDLVDVLLRIHRDSELQFPISMDSIKAIVAERRFGQVSGESRPAAGNTASSS
ncbi:hypothetical protein BAE44_0012638 [Dichanthelium oligosanthes]|uniref:Uncharacterized protein n=1 Tax=Dichanthelium oligosanthes TaxID=888268 RepID=A0A1E5VMI7_9POAL|nr:hypothetical protein BAE44_0012638 [Dichanthelium oligosanthes]